MADAAPSSGAGALLPPQVSFLARLIAEQPARRRSPGLAGQMARLGIGRHDRTKSFVEYGAADFRLADWFLRRAHADGRIPAPEEVAAPAPSMRINHVAAVPMGMPQHGLPEACSYAGLEVAAAAALPAQVVLVVERLELLPLAGRMQWLSTLIGGRRVLAMFRGDRGHYREAAARALLARVSVPTIALFDFTPRSLWLASELPRLEQLCLPQDFTGLATIKRSVLLGQSRLYERRLELVTAEPIVTAWRRFKDDGVGLRARDFPLLPA